MSNAMSTDLVVLGGGPGGYAAAFLAADRGVQTTLIDATAKPGGTSGLSERIGAGLPVWCPMILSTNVPPGKGYLPVKVK